MSMQPRFSYLWGSELDAGALNAMLHHGFEATRVCFHSNESPWLATYHDHK
jgi:hypothetical protein